jgi:uncharacterized damage-inducible protein DinB
MLTFDADYLDRLKSLYNDLKQSIAGLSPEALDWIPGADMNSLCVQIVHITAATRYWVGDLAAQIPSNRNRPAEFQARGMDEAALRKLLDESFAFVEQFVTTLTLADLEHERPHQPIMPPTERTTLSVGWGLLHALQHTALHVGHAQITRQLWDQRQPPPK